MNSDELRSLRTLRQLREQRASSELAAQQQRCRDSHQLLDNAKEKLRLHRESIARRAEAIYGNFSEGLSISAWHAAQAQLSEWADNQRALEDSVQYNAEALGAQEELRDTFRHAHILRRRQAEALDALFETALKAERQQRGRREEADELPAAGPGHRT
nr:hypothetical protein [uncultured Pseudomonas sp.]